MISVSGVYEKSDYEKALENAINTALASVSGNITTLSGNVTTLSGNFTALNDFVAVSVSTAVFTLNLTTYRNFTITNADTSGKTLKIANVPTAADTAFDVDVLLRFTTTATFTYTGTITWSQATAPAPSAAGTFVLNLKSFDAGANWYGSYTGLY